MFPDTSIYFCHLFFLSSLLKWLTSAVLVFLVHYLNIYTVVGFILNNDIYSQNNYIGDNGISMSISYRLADYKNIT